jgi:MFS family permease
MGKVLKNSWALFAGIGIILLANGLQGNLMGVRSVIENFSSLSTGILMSGYFVGYFVGSNLTPTLVSRVGHIRVFAAFASTASLSILIIATYVNPVVWTLGRFLTGLSLVSCYIVAESWLNDRANNRTRGKLLSIYMIINYFGLAFGALLLNFDDPQSYKPFVLVSILLSVALIPILLTKRPAPKFKKIGTLNLKELYNISPLGTVSSFCTGAIYSALFAMFAVYATKVNFTLFEISLLLFLTTITGAFFQGPVGYLSDKFNRRIVIILCALSGGLLCLLLIVVAGDKLSNINALHELLNVNILQSFKLITYAGKNKLYFFIIITIYTGITLCIFSLNLAHTNDFVPKEKFVAAGGGLQFVFGLGAMGGPFLCSIAMDKLGPNGYFIYLFVFHVIIVLFGLYRMAVRKVAENPDNTFTSLPRNITPAGIELEPDTGVDLSNNEKVVAN